MTPDKILKMTRRQISNLLDGLASRKQGYPDSKDTVIIETSEDLDAKIKALNQKRFGK